MSGSRWPLTPSARIARAISSVKNGLPPLVVAISRASARSSPATRVAASSSAAIGANGPSYEPLAALAVGEP